ncbi:MAG: type III polyketide synthase, partial [Candidatus Paceibacterales bacterium]
MSADLELNKLEKRLFKTMYREAGIEYRHSVLKDFSESKENFSFFPKDPTLPFPSTEKRMKIYKQNALPLALKAIENCFSSFHDFNKNKITHLITVSCTGMSAPGLDIELIESLNLPKTTHRTAVNFMGCYGVYNGLKTAHAICKANKNAKVLLVSVELCTLHFQKNKIIDHLISSAIFSDGAGALLIENTASSSQNQQFIMNSFYADILSEGKNDMTWEIGDQGFDIQLSSYVPQLIERGISEFAKNLLANTALTSKHVDYYAIHPGSKRILEACERALNITPSDNRFSYEILSNYGN